MKINCPKCASKDIAPPLAGRLRCNTCKHEFKPAEGLISLSQALTLGKALNHQTRRDILLQFVGKQELSANEIAKLLDEGLSQVSYHMKMLRDTKPPFLLKTKQRQVRGAIEKFYRVNPSVAH